MVVDEAVYIGAGSVVGNPALMYNYTDCPIDRAYGYPADYDPGDLRHLMRDVARGQFSYTSDMKLQHQGRIRYERILDQGVTRLSAAYAWRHWLSAYPNQTCLGPDVMELTERSRKYVPKNVDAPTTIRACAKALMEMGHIERYVWAKHAVDIRSWILAGFGPVVVTAPWYEDLDNPISTVAHARGEIVAWHSFLLLGCTPSYDAFTMVNSHGLQWGRNGKKLLPVNDMQLMLENGAIACSSPTKTVGAKARALMQKNKRVTVRL